MVADTDWPRHALDGADPERLECTLTRPEGRRSLTRYRSYILCTSPRSGSTLLCGLLAATGRAGNPDSHFHEPSLAQWLEDYNLAPGSFAAERDALAAVFDAARTRGSGDTGLFGLRLQRHSFGFFLRKLDVLHPGLACDRDRIRAAFGETLFLHLTRSDKLAQAISYVKAGQTGLWHRAPDGTELERLAPQAAPVYDADAIARQIREFTAFDAAWRDWFAREGIAPLQLSYDALSADPATALAGVLDALGLDRGLAAGIRPPVAKLADATNRDWTTRFLAEGGSRQKSD